MSVQSNLRYVPGLVAGADYSASSNQFTIVKQSTTAPGTVLQCGAATDKILGVLQDNPSSGQAATVTREGESKVVAGGTVTEGDTLTTNASGQAVTAVDGTDTTKYRLGIALESAVSGQVFRVALQIGGRCS